MNRGNVLRVVRIVSLLIILVAALFLVFQAVAVNSSTGAAQVGTALADLEANSTTAENVYQQQVVAQWAAKDLLAVVASQNSVMIENQGSIIKSVESLKALLGLVIAALVVIGATLLDRGKMAKPTGSTAAPTAVDVPPVTTQGETAPDGLTRIEPTS